MAGTARSVAIPNAAELGLTDVDMATEEGSTIRITGTVTGSYSFLAALARAVQGVSKVDEVRYAKLRDNRLSLVLTTNDNETPWGTTARIFSAIYQAIPRKVRR